jgi:hypothetical protein
MLLHEVRGDEGLLPRHAFRTLYRNHIVLVACHEVQVLRVVHARDLESVDRAFC